ncbi:MAG TPA: hypothetical protein VE641_05860 [Chthoniobacterales bacterium]|nr:hypothetical protein [Chthoniobacterales bacterium]
MSDVLTTVNSSAESEGKDPRTVALLLARQGVQPVARLHGQKRTQPLYDREEAKRILAKALQPMFGKGEKK